MLQAVKRMAKRTKAGTMAVLATKTASVHEGRVYLSNFDGLGFGCNPKYIAIEMHGRPEFREFFWVVKEGESESLPSWVTPVRRGTLAAYRAMASAQVWVLNTRNARHVAKRPGQYYVQTWHAGVAPKMIERDVEHDLDQGYVREAKLDGSLTDLMFASSDFSERIFRDSFWYSGPVIRCGEPRNQPLLKDCTIIAEGVKRTYGIPSGVGLCLYAPTFRSSGKSSVDGFDVETALAALQNRFGHEFVLGLRLHPNDSMRLDELPSSRVIDMGSYPDCQELLAASEVLVTDYSSVYESFALTRRPAFVFAGDYDEYVQSERRLHYPLEDRPAPVAKNMGEFVANVGAYDQEEYEFNIDSFFKRFGFSDDGRGAVAVVDRVVEDLGRLGPIPAA